MGRPKPPFVRSTVDDLRSVTRLILIDFLCSMILWPFILVVSLLLIPLTSLGRWVLLVSSLPCTCSSRLFIRCTCREFATATESLWIGYNDIVAPWEELRRRSIEFIEKRKVVDTIVTVEETIEPLMTSTTPQSPTKMITKNVHSLVLVVEQSLDVHNLIDLVQQRMCTLRSTNGRGKYFPRFTQCLVRIKGGSLVWVDDPTFSLSQHVIECTDSLPDQSHLEQFLQTKSREGLVCDRPLWQLYIVNEYGSFKDKMLLWRFHGSMYDGVTISKVLTYALGDPTNHCYKAHNQHHLYRDHIVKFLLNGPVRFLRLLTNKPVDANPQHRRGVAHQFNWSEKTLNLPMLVKNKMLLNMAFNDVLLSIMAGAVHGQSPETDEDSSPCTTAYMMPSKGNVLVPFNLWTHLNKRLTLPQGNHVLMLPCSVSHQAEVVPRLWHTERYFSKLKNCGDTRTKLYFLDWLHWLPFTYRLCRYVNNRIHGGCASLFTSFLGPNNIEGVVGADIKDIMFFTSPPDGVSRSFNFISYAGTIKLTTLSIEELAPNTIDVLITNMATQLNQINKMVFHRYFPEGVNTRCCPYLQPQSSKFLTEFMAKLAELDALSHGIIPVPRPNADIPNSTLPGGASVDRVGDEATSQERIEAAPMRGMSNSVEMAAASGSKPAHETNPALAEADAIASTEVVIEDQPKEVTPNMDAHADLGHAAKVKTDALKSEGNLKPTVSPNSNIASIDNLANNGEPIIELSPGETNSNHDSVGLEIGNAQSSGGNSNISDKSIANHSESQPVVPSLEIDHKFELPTT